MKGKSFKSVEKNSKNIELWLALWNIKKCEAYRKENHKINKDVYYDNKHMKETIINKISAKSKPQPLPDLKNGLKTKHESSNKEETKNKETYKIALPKRRIFNHKKILPLNSIYPLKFRQHISRINRNNDNLRKIKTNYSTDLLEEKQNNKTLEISDLALLTNFPLNEICSRNMNGEVAVNNDINSNDQIHLMHYKTKTINRIKSKRNIINKNLDHGFGVTKTGKSQIKNIILRKSYMILPGNNSKLISTCMERRNSVWVPSDKFNTFPVSFIWRPVSVDSDFSKNENCILNHLEFNREICNKMYLFANIFKYCERFPKIGNIFSFIPLSIIIPIKSRYDVYSEQLLGFKRLFDKIPSIIYKYAKPEVYSDLFKIFILSNHIGEKTQINLPESMYAGQNMWLIKPVNFNRGRFISIENDYHKIVSSIEKLRNNNGNNNNNLDFTYLIIQKYIEKPLLFEGKKFDIRIWVLYIGNKPDFVYIFKEGHLKITCENYSIFSNEGFVHLTNYSVQKYHNEFGEREKGNEISYQQFQDELNTKHYGIDFRKEIYPKICKIIKIAFNSVKERINFLNRKNCFELFGCDFLIDENYDPFLIEINTNPGLEESSPLIAKLTHRLIDDLLKLIVDKSPELSTSKLKGKPFHVEGYDDNENMWERFSL